MLGDRRSTALYGQYERDPITAFGANAMASPNRQWSDHLGVPMQPIAAPAPLLNVWNAPMTLVQYEPGAQTQNPYLRRQKSNYLFLPIGRKNLAPGGSL